MAQATNDPFTRGDDVYAALTRMMRGFKRMATVGLVDGPTLGVMFEIHSRGPVRLSDIATCVGLDASTVSRHVAGLERDGHVAREADPADGRASRLVLTEGGRSVMTQAIERRRAVFGAALEDWSQPDRESLQRLFDRLADDIERVTSAASGSRQEQSV